MGGFLLQGFEINPDYEVVAGIAGKENLPGVLATHTVVMGDES